MALAFLDSWICEGDRQRCEPLALEAALDQLVAAATVAWPGLELEPARLARHLAAVVPGDADPVEHLTSAGAVAAASGAPPARAV